MRALNRAEIIGNLGADPETRYTPSGTAVSNLRVATTENWKDRQTGEQQEKTEWHRVTLFNRMAEVAAEYLRKGSKVYIAGKIQTRKWQDQNGNDRYTTEIVGNDLIMLDGGARHARSETDPNRGPGPASHDRDGNPQGPAPADDFDDDIPFSFAIAAPIAGTIISLFQGAAGFVV